MSDGAPEWYRKLTAGGLGAPLPPASPPDARSLLGAAPAYTGPKPAGPAGAYWGLATQAAQRHGLDPSLLAAVWDFESSGNPGAINKSSGATGLGQVMPRERGFPDRPTQQELLNPETNAEWSARILKSGLQRYGSEDKALAAYLGAIDARGNITGAVDANGTGGNQYIRTVRERQLRYTGAGTPAAAPAGADPGAPAWYQKLTATGGASTAPTAPSPRPTAGASTTTAPAPGPGDQTGAVGKQAIAASWALSNLAKAYYDLCQRFIEQAYGTGGHFGSAAAAGKALVKTANPGEADVGDLVFFRPDASNGYAGHAAIYLGNGEMVGATYGGVTRDRIDSPYWSKLLLGFADPPAQWQGRPNDAALAKGASQLLSSAQRAAGGSPSGTESGGAPPAWYQKLLGA